MTRQNVTDGPREILTRKCPVCDGDGIVVSDTTVAMAIERKLRDLGSSASRVQAYRVAVHPRILSLLAGPGGSRLAAIEEAAKRRFFLVAATDGHVHTDHFDVQAEGKLLELQPAGPAEGSEVEVKLVELGLHDAAAGVGKVDGINVIVANAASLVGKKAKVLVGRTLEGQAFGTLVAADGSSGQGPITFESEAEKPTRAPAKRREALEVGAEPVEGDALDDDIEIDGAEPDDIESEQPDPEDDEPAAEVVLGEDGLPIPPKKRTRRGSRGGRRRRKPAGAGAATGDTDAEGAETEDSDVEVDETATGEVAADDAPATPKPRPPRPPRQRTPKIHVPTDDLVAANGAAPVETPAEAGAEESVDGAAEPGPTKPKTRRGSRGGRNRRKKPAGTATGAAEANGAADSEVTEGAHIDEAPDAGRSGESAVEPTAEPVPVAVVAKPAVDASADGGYVPMSEWLDDLDR